MCVRERERESESECVCVKERVHVCENTEVIEWCYVSTLKHLIVVVNIKINES